MLMQAERRHKGETRVQRLLYASLAFLLITPWFGGIGASQSYNAGTTAGWWSQPVGGTGSGTADAKTYLHISLPDFPRPSSIVVSNAIPEAQTTTSGAAETPSLTSAMQSGGLYTPIFSTSSHVVAGERRRDRVRVYAEVLHRLSATPLGLTELALFCRLNFRAMKECLDILVASGLLEQVNTSHSMKYATTPKGIEFLQLAERTFSFVSNS